MQLALAAESVRTACLPAAAPATRYDSYGLLEVASNLTEKQPAPQLDVKRALLQTVSYQDAAKISAAYILHHAGTTPLDGRALHCTWTGHA